MSKVSTSRRSFDLFSDRLQSLQSGLLYRCIALKDQERKQMWAQFSSSFNRDLSGRSPFKMPISPGAGSAAGGANRSESPPADIDDVATALTQFDRVQKALSDVPPSSGGAKSPMAYPLHIKKFEEQFTKVRQLLAPLFPAEPGALAGYDLNVDFRANTSDEKEGGRIIDWSISSGSQTLRWRDSGKSLYWEPGMPITLSLRIAKDSPLKPKLEAKQAEMSVDDKTVTYRYNDPWALFSILAVHREMDRNPRADGRAQLLRFEFPLLAQSDDGKSLGPETQARVFIRLGVSPAGKKTWLTWPTSFPTKAPDWTMP